MFYIEKEAGMKSTDWRGRKGMWRPLPSARPPTSSTPSTSIQPPPRRAPTAAGRGHGFGWGQLLSPWCGQHNGSLVWLWRF